jgi:2'-5' RNA ligase
VALAAALWTDDADPRPFAGHLTLARVRGRARGPARLAGALIGASWPVEEIALMSSTLSSEGARYRVERAWPLG